MTIFPQTHVEDALAFAQAGGQALHVLGVTPGRLYDRDLPRLVSTARSFGLREVFVARTGTPWQHVELRGMPLIRACMDARTVEDSKTQFPGASFGGITPLQMVDILHEAHTASALARAQRATA